ncbi:MAG TPA: ethanolamine ammonia-lyase subunit EutC [Rummeliibacillus sp.]|nr:ethanolamine ammonia-lyase subunit EutC [Rummeliibacillus sp.]
MDEQLVEKITSMIVEKLNTIQQQESHSLIQEKPWTITEQNHKEIKIEDYVTFHHTQIEAEEKKEAPLYDSLQDEELDAVKKELQMKTPARIAVGRAGSRPKTKTWLKFRYDHAAAVDAVYGEVPKEIFEKLDFFQVRTKVQDKEEYIRRPDLGRRLSEGSKKTVVEKCKNNPQVQIIVSNGLSAKAIEENLEDVYLSLQQSLRNLNIEIGTTFYIDKGRVALMDEIGELLQAEVVVILIGERPGLVAADSMSAYLCYKPRFGTIEADRIVVSNIHKGGIPSVEAGAYLGSLIQKILKYKTSGISLANKED